MLTCKLATSAVAVLAFGSPLAGAHESDAAGNIAAGEDTAGRRYTRVARTVSEIGRAHV